MSRRWVCVTSQQFTIETREIGEHSGSEALELEVGEFVGAGMERIGRIAGEWRIENADRSNDHGGSVFVSQDDARGI